MVARQNVRRGDISFKLRVKFWTLAEKILGHKGKLYDIETNVLFFFAYYVLHWEITKGPKF